MRGNAAGDMATEEKSKRACKGPDGWLWTVDGGWLIPRKAEAAPAALCACPVREGLQCRSSV